MHDVFDSGILTGHVDSFLSMYSVLPSDYIKTLKA